MATLRIRFWKRTGTKAFESECVLTAHIVAKRMTKKWLTDHYGKDSSTKEMYLCHANPYGIKWAMAMQSRVNYDVHFDICTNPELVITPLPYYDYLTYSKE